MKGTVLLLWTPKEGYETSAKTAFTAPTNNKRLNEFSGHNCCIA